jgi:hypothetical protein
MLVCYCNTTRHHNPEDLNLNHHHHESLKTCNPEDLNFTNS